MRLREPYEYDQVPAAEVLRPLDPTEHDMERLNRVGGGAGLVYQTARVRGRIARAELEAAVTLSAPHHLWDRRSSARRSCGRWRPRRAAAG